MKTLNLIFLLGSGLTLPAVAQTTRVGVGTTTPRAGLDVDHPDGLVVTGTFGNGNTADLPTGAGTRLLWLPAKASFRAGRVSRDDEWSLANTGICSVALGDAPLASGDYSVALGYETTASGETSVAVGERSIASGPNSVALGYHANTNGKPGSFVLADGSTDDDLLSSEVHQLSARFVGGYRLYTNALMNLGVSLAAGGNAWQTISDSTKKEGFRPADGQAFLQKIASMRLGSWNYRGQDAATRRHYGPMAQDFFAAFGHDGVGVIGTDTTINQADFDGVNLIAIQALTYKTDRLEVENQRLRAENRDFRRLLTELTAEVRSLKTTVSTAASR